MDLVRDVRLVAPMDKSLRLTTEMKTIGYHITWLEPLSPNGLVYFYTIHIDQYTQNAPKDERCVGHNIHSINVSLSPRTNYRLKIITYTVARFNHEYGDHKQLSDDSSILNTTNLYYQMFFTTIDLPSKFRTSIARIINVDSVLSILVISNDVIKILTVIELKASV